MVNPLTVSINSKGKERLILDLRHVNKQVVLNKIKFENWITLKQYATKGGFGFFFLSQIGLPEMFKIMRLLVDNRSSTMFSSGGPDYFLPDLKFLS